MAALEVEGNAIDSLDMTHGLGHQAALDGEVFFKLVDPVSYTHLSSVAGLGSLNRQLPR